MLEQKPTDQKAIQEAMEKKLYERNFNKWGFDLNLFVSIGTILMVCLLGLYAILANAQVFGFAPANEVFSRVRQFLVGNTDWLFILIVNSFILLCIFLAFSKLGRVRLGGMKARPEFSNFAWYSMLLSAGMGIGLMFWAVGEPLSHFNNPGPIFNHENGAISAMASTFLHWGLHPWAIYAVMALSLAYFAYNKNMPLSLRSVFYPLFKERVFGRLGDIIDLIAVVATMVGLATSLGLGVQQINSGLNYLVGMSISTFMQVILITAITLVAVYSILSGIDKGVKTLSKWTIKLSFIFMILIILLGPTLYIIRLFTTSLGFYVGELPSASFFLALESGSAREWQSAWTIFYLAWWVSWSPFVGMFIARVSKGRTIREFIIAVLLVPSLISFIWLSTFGGTAFSIDSFASGGDLYTVSSEQLPIALFELIQRLDIALLQNIAVVSLSVLATGIIIFFFITSSDSGSIVVNAITSGGKTSTKSRQRVLWAVAEGFIAAILIIIGGEMALETLQDAVILTGLPFVLLMLAMCVLLVQNLQATYQKQERQKQITHIRSLLECDDITDG